MRLPSPLVAFVTLALPFPAGCGTSVASTYVNRHEPAPTSVARAPRGVQVFATAPPERRYREVALLDVQQTRGLNDQGTDVMLDRLRERAGEMGCEGVVLGGVSETAMTPADARLIQSYSPG